MRISSTYKLFFSGLLLFALFLPLLTPMATAQETERGIYMDGVCYRLSVTPYAGEYGLVASAEDLAIAFGKEYTFDASAKAFTLYDGANGKIVLMHKATRFYRGDTTYSCLPYFYVENAVPMVNIHFLCELLGAAYRYDTDREILYLEETDLSVATLAEAETMDLLSSKNIGSVSGMISYAQGAPAGGLEAELLLSAVIVRDTLYSYGDTVLSPITLGSTYLSAGETEAIYSYDVSAFRGIYDSYILHCNIPELEYTGYASSYGTTTQVAYEDLTMYSDTTLLSFDAEAVVDFSITESTIRFAYDGETLTISGSGDLIAVPDTYKKAAHVIIENGVTSIGSRAFYSWNDLETVTIAEGVRNIGDYAFSYCDSLTEITIPNSVYNVGERAFYACEDLTAVSVGNGTKQIGAYAFANCSSLVDLLLGEQLQSIDGYAFYQCTDLTKVSLTSNVRSIGERAFAKCFSLQEADLGTGLQSIGYAAFYQCVDLTEIIIPDSVTIIGSEAFYNCYSLQNVTLGNSVRYIQASAFFACYDLRSIVIPSSVIQIGEWAFAKCISLESVQIESGMRYIGSYAFYQCEDLQKIRIPSVSTIGNRAFAECSSLESVTLSRGIDHVGYHAFFDCQDLTEIYVYGKATHLTADVFSGCYDLTVYGLAGSKAAAIAEALDLPFVTLPPPEIADTVQTVITEFIAADEDDEISFDEVVLANGWYLAAADLGLSAETPKVSYLGLPVTLYIDCTEENFERLYADGDAMIVSVDFPEYATVTNTGLSANIRYIADVEDPYVFLGGISFADAEYEIELFCFGKNGWERQDQDAWTAFANTFRYENGYIGDPYTCNTYGQVAYRVVEVEADKSIVEILYTPYAFGQYIERNMRYSVTGTQETFKIIGTYTGEKFETASGEETWFEERFVGSGSLVTNTSVTKQKGEVSLSATIKGEDIQSGDFMFYHYNAIDNILTVVQNYGPIQTGRVTALNETRQTAKIGGINYSFGFAGLYAPHAKFDAVTLRRFINTLQAGQENIQYLVVDGSIVFYAEYGTSLPQEYDLAVISTDATLMTELLGITEAKYRKSLIDGLYIENSYVYVAMLDLTTGKWELARIAGVATAYDSEMYEFTDYCDVATLAKYSEITNLTGDNLALYELGKKVLADTIVLIAGTSGDAYYLADADTLDAEGEYLNDRLENENGLYFNASGNRTNPIATSEKEDGKRITLDGESLIVAIGPDGVEIRSGIQHSKFSLIGTVTFYRADSDLILLTTEMNIAGWSQLVANTYFLVTPYSACEYDVTENEEYTLTVTDLFDLSTLEIAESLVFTGSSIEDLNAIPEFLVSGRLLQLDADGVLTDVTDTMTVEDAIIAAGERKNAFAATVTEFVDQSSITVLDGDTEVTNVSQAISSLTVNVHTLDLTEFDWEKMNSDNMYVEDVPYADGVYMGVERISIDGEDHYAYILDELKTGVEIAEPMEGIYSQFMIDAAAKNWTICVWDEWSEEYIPFTTKFHTIAEWDADTGDLHLTVLRVLTAGEHICDFGNWIITAEPTDEANGSQYRVCSLCGYEDNRVIKRNHPEIVITIGSSTGYVNGQAVTLDSPAFLSGNEVMMPVRFIAENLGATVAWDGITSTVTLTTDQVEIRIAIGEKTAKVNKKTVAVETPAMIRNSRTCLPTKFIVESLGVPYIWNEDSQTLTINPSKKPQKAVAFIDYNTGADSNNSLSADTAKKSFGTAISHGAMGLLTDGGTLVVSGKAYLGADYTIPALNGPLTITSVWDGTDYKNSEPATNPACAMKMASGKTLSIVGDVTLDDMILFQENGQNTIVVKEDGCLTITDKLVCMSKQPYYWDIVVEKGGKAIINGGIFSSISGEGDITVSDNVTVTGARVAGDIDGDGTVTVLDTLTVLKAILNNQMIPAADINGDGELTLVDIMRILKAITK